MDKPAFYESLRRRDNGVFGTSLSSSQVQGIEEILAECQAQGASLYQTAYILGTGYGESGRKMQPAYENLRYSARRIPQVFGASRRQGVPVSRLAGNPRLLANTVYGGPWGARNLGNTQDGDGWRFRGTGIGQITGRRNFAKWGKNMGLPLTENPELLMDLNTSVRALVQPMLEGWATGHRLDKYVSGNRKDYRAARRVWNGDFAAGDYAGYARAFEAALIAGGYEPSPARPAVIDHPVDTPRAGKPDYDPQSPHSGIFAALLALFKAISKRGGER